MSKKGYRISNEIKEQVLNRIKNEGVSVANAAADHGISTHTIYKWLGDGATTISVLEYNKLKKGISSSKKTNFTTILIIKL